MIAMTSDDSSALIGYTGFVGSNLLRQHSFDACFNSSNIEQIAGRGFDLVVCAGARAEKWKANAEPGRDLDNIERLTRALEQVNARKVVLISTVDVFINPIDVDEESPTPTAGLSPYGRHRRRLEQIVAGRFDSLVVRLGGLYGPGLKKNVIYDLLHDNNVAAIDSRGTFQYYDVSRLWRDIELALDNELTLAHLPTEPVSVAEVAFAAFGKNFENEVTPSPVRYDVHTRFASVFGGRNPYVETKADVLERLSKFVSAERRR
jgi:nucleoside-diphosphate-sugar epimerase